jgi:uncharacterized coiled-coil DUF342 family protein
MMKTIAAALVIVALTTKIALLYSELRDVKSQLSSYEESIKQLAALTTKRDLEYNETVRKLDKLRDREATVIAKPSLVEKKINEAFNKSQLELRCITGDKEACGK